MGLPDLDYLDVLRRAGSSYLPAYNVDKIVIRCPHVSRGLFTPHDAYEIGFWHCLSNEYQCQKHEYLINANNENAN